MLGKIPAARLALIARIAAHARRSPRYRRVSHRETQPLVRRSGTLDRQMTKLSCWVYCRFIRFRFNVVVTHNNSTKP